MSPSEDTILCTTENNQIWVSKLPVNIIETTSDADSERKSDKQDLRASSDSNRVCTISHPLLKNQELEKSLNIQARQEFEFLTSSFHAAQITGLDSCVRRPWVVTSSNDKTVRIWNHRTNNMEYLKSFAEDVYSVAMHPSGFHVLIGFTDKLRLMNVVLGDLLKVAEFDIRSCREVKNTYF